MQEDEKMLDVVEETSFQIQTDQYKNAYKRWRRKNGNRYAFAYTKHPKEQTFSENKAILKESPGSAEQAALWKLGNLIGTILIVYLVLENIVDKILVAVLNLLGFQIDMVFWTSTIYGKEELAFLVTGIIALMKYLVPMIILQCRLRMPACVGFPFRISRTAELFLGVSLVMLLSTGLGTFCVSRSAELQKYQLIADSITAGDQKIIGYMLFTVFLLPVLYELLLHGCMFQVLRQFGDAFAMGVLVLISALLAHNIPDIIRMCVISLTISYFVLRTGSFLTAAILHIVHEICMFSVYYIQNFEQVFSMQWWITLLLPCIVGLVAMVYILLHRKNFRMDIERNSAYLKRTECLMAFVTPIPMLGLLMICLILTVMSIMIQ